MKIRVQVSTALDGQQAVEPSADASEIESAHVEVPVELTAAENAGLNSLTSASALDAMLSQKESPTAIQSDPLPISDVANSSTESLSFTSVSDSATTQKNVFSTISDNGADALNALVQSAANSAATPTVPSEQKIAVSDTGPASSTDSTNLKHGTASEVSQPGMPRVSFVTTSTQEVPDQTSSVGKQVAGNPAEMPTSIAGIIRTEPGLVERRQSAGEALISSLADGSSSSSSSTGLQDNIGTQPSVPQDPTVAPRDDTNLAQLRALGLLPPESETLSSDVAFHDAQRENINTAVPSSKTIISAYPASTEDGIANLHATSPDSFDQTIQQKIEQTSGKPSHFADIGPTSSSEIEGGSPSQGSQVPIEEVAAQRPASVISNQYLLSTIDATQATVDTAAAAAAQAQRQPSFSKPADVETPASPQSGQGGQHTGSQDNQSAGKNSGSSSHIGDGDGTLPILSSYRAPLFNRRLETNGVDDALILLLASLKETRAGHVVEPIRLQPVAAVQVVTSQEESPEERAADAAFPTQVKERRRWLRTLSLPRPYFNFNSDAFERASRETLQQRPSMQRRRPQNPIMSDPRSTGVVERAAFWVSADMDKGGLHQLARSLTISATTSHRALHPIWMQPHVNCSVTL